MNSVVRQMNQPIVAVKVTARSQRVNVLPRHVLMRWAVQWAAITLGHHHRGTPLLAETHGY